MTTFVLVPGAWLGSWVWGRVTPHLQKEGNRVYPVTLTGMGERVHLFSADVGIETAVNDVINIIRYNELKNVVLVGHSFATKVVSVVGDRLPTIVKKIIYLDTFRPDKIRTPQQSFQPDEFGELKPGQLAIPFTDKVLDTIGRDVRGTDKEWMKSLATPWPLRYATDPITLTENYDTIEAAHVFCTKSDYDVKDPITGKWGVLEGEYRTIESAHFPMVTKPEDTARSLIDLSS
jgi:pimeloyl-ACP methyl ester carboxylesterase